MELELSEYQQDWPSKFEQEKIFLMDTIGRWLHGSIEHVGSTAIPGMRAKPIIDIMFGIKDLESAREAIGILESAGYCYYPYKEEVMHWFCKPTPDIRTHHLHLVPFNSELWQQRLRFRDILRSDSGVAKEYATLKKSLAQQFASDRETYTQKKWPFIQHVLNNSL